MTIMMKWIDLGIAILIGLIFLKMWLLRSEGKELGNKMFDLLSNSVFWGFLIWKGSLLLLDPKLVIKSPLSLLYFTGGNNGLILGIIGAFIYILSKARNVNLSFFITLKYTIIFSLVILSGYYLLSSVKTPELTHDNPASTTATGKEKIEIGVQEGNKAPDFQLKTIDGEELKLSDMEGKKVILNFWATWCPPCKAEIPHMQDFYVDQTINNVEILAINLTTSEKSNKSVKEFVRDNHVTFPVLLDQDGDIGDQYQAITIPTSYVIDSQGIIRKKIIGPMDKSMMAQLIDNVD